MDHEGLQHHNWVEERDETGRPVLVCRPTGSDCPGCGIRVAKHQVLVTFGSRRDIGTAADLFVTSGRAVLRLQRLDRAS